MHYAGVAVDFFVVHSEESCEESER
jgi:hypothetical protein